ARYQRGDLTDNEALSGAHPSRSVRGGQRLTRRRRLRPRDVRTACVSPVRPTARTQCTERLPEHHAVNVRAIRVGYRRAAFDPTTRDLGRIDPCRHLDLTR